MSNRIRDILKLQYKKGFKDSIIPATNLGQLLVLRAPNIKLTKA